MSSSLFLLLEPALESFSAFSSAPPLPKLSSAVVRLLSSCHTRAPTLIVLRLLRRLH